MQGRRGEAGGRSARAVGAPGACMVRLDRGDKAGRRAELSWKLALAPALAPPVPGQKATVRPPARGCLLSGCRPLFRADSCPLQPALRWPRQLVGHLQPGHAGSAGGCPRGRPPWKSNMRAGSSGGCPPACGHAPVVSQLRPPINTLPSCLAMACGEGCCAHAPRAGAAASPRAVRRGVVLLLRPSSLQPAAAVQVQPAPGRGQGGSGGRRPVGGRWVGGRWRRRPRLPHFSWSGQARHRPIGPRAPLGMFLGARERPGDAAIAKAAAASALGRRGGATAAAHVAAAAEGATGAGGGRSQAYHPHSARTRVSEPHL